ncbi:MAG: cytochrome c [Acidiferrobacterales bacterium]
MKYKILWMLPTLLLIGCDGESHKQSTQMYPGMSNASKPAANTVTRRANFSTVQQGFKLYRANCASCHGDQGQGDPNWRQAGPDGKYPASPLNGTGHAWHHPMPVLVSTIKNGTQRIGGNMPAWKDKLTDTEIHAIIAWFQSRWPDKLYQAWARTNRDAAQSSRK